MAAGHGTRMKSKTPKVLHKVGGRTMLDRVIDTVQRFVVARCAERPLLLVLDDLQWADPASLRVIEFLAGELKRLRDLHHMHCPKCGLQLQEVKLRNVDVDVCFSCNGVFFDAQVIIQAVPASTSPAQLIAERLTGCRGVAGAKRVDLAQPHRIHT